MFKRFFSAAFSSLTIALNAGVGGPSTYDGFFYLDFYRSTAQNRSITVGHNGETIANNVPIPGTGFHVEAFSRPMKPGVLYPLTVTRGSDVRYGIGVIAPEGYMAEIDGEFRNGFYVDSTVADTVTYQVALRSLAASGNVIEAGQSSGLRIGDIGWEVGLGRMSNGSGAGFVQLVAKELTPEVYTRTGLGVHLPPHNPDEIHAIYEDLDSDNVLETIRQIRAAQCLVDFVDTSSTGGQVTAYEIRFYRSGTFDSGTGLYTPTGSALITYNIAKSAASALTITRTDAWGAITSTATATPDGNLYDWDLTVTGGDYVKKTSINSSPITNGRREDIEVRYTATPGGMPAAATKTFKTRRDFQNFAATGRFQVTEKLIAQTHNHGIAGQERTERFSYWDNPSDSDYGQLKFREGAFGDWNLFGYEDIFYAGPGQTVVHDFIQWSQANRVFGAVSALIPRQRKLVHDFSSENDTLNFVFGTTTIANVQSAYNAGNVRLNEPFLAYGWDELNAISTTVTQHLGISGVKRYTARKFASPLVFPLDYNASGQNDNFIELNRLYHTPNTAGINGTDDRAIHWAARYVPSGYATGFDKRLSFKPYMTVSPDDVKKAHGYAKVSSYEGISDAWVEVDVVGIQGEEIIDNTTQRIISVTSAATGQTFNGNFAKPFLYEMAGRLVDSLSYPGALRNTVYADATARYVNPQNLNHGGVTVRMDVVQLVPGKSVKAVRAYNAHGELAREERWAYDSGGDWKLSEILTHGRDGYGRITSITRHDGASSAQRLVYEAGYNGVMLVWEKDAAGIRTDYVYDGLGRISSKAITAAHGLVDVPASLTTTSKLDAMDRVVELETGGLTETAEYDARDLLLSKADVNGLTTGFVYSREPGAGMRVDISHPGGGTETRIHHRNGRLKSVTGTAVVTTHYSYTYDHASTGNLQTRVDAVLPSTNGARHPWGRVWTDWTGRVTREEHSTPATQNFTRTHTYNGINARLEQTVETEVSANGGSVTQSLAKVFGFDVMGFASVSGIDVNGGGLSNASTDRLARSETNFVTIGGGLYEETVTTTYPEDGLATGVTTTTRSKINGMAAGTLSETTVTDIRGNEMIAVVSLNRATATVSSVVSHSDSTSESSISVMGFPVSATSRQGRVSSVKYDGMGRVWLEITATASRSFATKTEFEAGKARVWKVTTGLAADGTGAGYPTTYLYDSAGRVSVITDAKGGTTYYAYNHRGQPVKSWGTAVKPVWYEYDPDYGTLSKQHTWAVMPGAAPDLGTATAPPTGSSVVHFVRDNASGVVTKRTDAFGTADARVTDYTYDVLGQLRTTQTPSSVNGTHSVATSRITITRQYFPKTKELSSVTYSGGTAPSLSFTWHRSGELKTATEGGSFTRTFHHDHSGNGDTALRQLAEDLPSYYSTLPALATNDTAHGANRIARSHTTTGIRGLPAGASSGVATGASGLSATRTSTSWSWTGGLISDAAFEGADLEYGYETGSAMLNRRSVSQFEETRGFEQDRDLLGWIGTKGGGASRVRFDYTLDSLGRRESARQSGTVFDSYGGSLFADLGYDSRHRLTSHTVHSGHDAGSPVLPGRAFGYEYDLADNRRVASRADAPQGATSFNWGVNALNEITTRQTPQWSEVSGFAPHYRGIALLPPPGDSAVEPNRTKDHFHAYHTTPPGAGVRLGEVELLYAERGMGGPDADNPPHRKDLLDRRTVVSPVRPPTETLKYDGRGNLASDSMWSYTWDGADRLIAVESSATAIAAGLEKVKLTFQYDWMGRRYAKRSHPWTGAAFAANPDKVTLYWWDDWHLLREASYDVTAWSGSNPSAATFVSETRYHWGIDLSGTPGGAGGVGGLIGIATRQAGQAVSAPLFPAYDGNGNVIALLNAEGEVRAAYEYDPYGRLLRTGGTAADLNPFRFATKYYDRETKLYYHNERYYSPELGRFLGIDPIREAGGRNLHAYTGNNPANAFDVLGRFTFFWSGGGGGGASGFTTSTGGSGSSISFSYNPGSWGGGSIGSGSQNWAAVVSDMRQAQIIEQIGEIGDQFNRNLQSFRATVDVSTAGSLNLGGYSAAKESVGNNPAGSPPLDTRFDATFQLWAAGASPAALNAEADSGRHDAKTTRMLRIYSQNASDRAHDMRIIGGTIEGAGWLLALAEPTPFGESLMSGRAVLGTAKAQASVGGRAAQTPAPSLWSKAEFKGTRVYQRDDLIDAALVDARGRTNLERMQSGLAPIGPDGKSLNLHHTIQTADGPLAEMTATFHQQNSRVIHINPNTIPSGIDRQAFDAFRRDYWMNRASDFSP